MAFLKAKNWAGSTLAIAINDVEISLTDECLLRHAFYRRTE